MNLGTVLSNIGSGVANTTKTAINNVASYKAMGAGMANAASAQAQQNQFAYNSAEAVNQREYNEAMWDKNASYNSAEASIAREFNSAEAQKNRDWQERMSNTAYQRAVADLKKAGLNPVLAAFNGGASTGSGATASGGAASASAASSGMASGSNYNGQGYQMSDALAIFGAIGGLVGDALSAMGALILDQQDQKMWEGFHALYKDASYENSRKSEVARRYYGNNPEAMNSAINRKRNAVGQWAYTHPDSFTNSINRRDRYR